MNVRAASEQRQEALWGVFLMFVVMALIIVRTGVACRSVAAVLPRQGEAEDAALGLDHGPPSPSSGDVYRAVVVVLGLAEAAGRLLALEARTDWELMNQPVARPARRQRSAVADRCGRLRQRLDTS